MNLRKGENGCRRACLHFPGRCLRMGRLSDFVRKRDYANITLMDTSHMEMRQQEEEEKRKEDEDAFAAVDPHGT